MQGPLTTAHAEEQPSCCRSFDEGLLEFQLCQQLREGCKISVPQERLFPRCAARLLASRDPRASPASCWSWTTASPVSYEWISSLFESLPPNPNVFQKHSGKTPKKALLSTYTSSLTTSLHALQFSQVQFFHTIDDFMGFCQIPFNSLFFLS